MDRYDWALLFFCVFAVIVNRKTASYHDFFRLNPPAWFRRILFVVDVKVDTIGVGTIIEQAALNIFTMFYILSLLSFDILFFLPGDYQYYIVLFTFVMFPLMVLCTIYMFVCDFVINRREKKENKKQNEGKTDI
jgi:hypothetical protein